MWCPKCHRETDLQCETSCDFFLTLDIEDEDIMEEWEEEDELQDN